MSLELTTTPSRNVHVYIFEYDLLRCQHSKVTLSLDNKQRSVVTALHPIWKRSMQEGLSLWTWLSVH